MARIAWLCISLLLCGAECLRISTTDPDCCWVADWFGSLYYGSLEKCTSYPGRKNVPLAGMEGKTCHKQGAMLAIKEQFEQACAVPLNGDQFQSHDKKGRTTRLHDAFEVKDFFESLKTFQIDDTGLEKYRRFVEVKNKVAGIVTNFKENKKNYETWVLMEKLCNNSRRDVCVVENIREQLPGLCEAAEVAREEAKAQKTKDDRKRWVEEGLAQKKKAALGRRVKAELEKRVAELKARAAEEARKEEEAALKLREEAEKREREKRLNNLPQYPRDGLKAVVNQALTSGWRDGGDAAENLARALVTMSWKNWGNIPRTYALVAGLIKKLYNGTGGVDTKLEEMLSGFLEVEKNFGYVIDAIDNFADANEPLEREDKFPICCAFRYAQKKPEEIWDVLDAKDKCKNDEACSRFPSE